MAGQCVQPFETSVPYLNKNKKTPEVLVLFYHKNSWFVLDICRKTHRDLKILLFKFTK